jgi:hypothetical protein
MSDIDPDLAPLLRAAQDFVRRATGLELDDSETALAYADHYVRESRRVGPLRPEVLDLAAAALGAWFGELARARFGGRWHKTGGSSAEWELALGAAPLRFRPVAFAATALMGGEAPGYDATLATEPRWEPALVDALDALPPVAEDHFFSLTGRFEALESAVDILVELRRQDGEREG